MSKTPPKITLKVAERMAALAFGPSAQVKRHHEPKDRNRRFAIYFTDEAPADRQKQGYKQAVYLAGHGDSWEKAFKMANDNPFAQEKAKKIVELRKEFTEKKALLDQKQSKSKKEE